jgi:hypothetical protein
MKVLSFATLCLASLISYTVKANYPFVIYTGASANDKPVEVQAPVTFDSVVSKYQEVAAGKTNILVFVKEGLTTSNFANAGKDYAYVKDKIMGHSYIYTDVNSGFDLAAFEKNIDPVYMKYDIESLADLDSVNT